MCGRADQSGEGEGAAVCGPGDVGDDGGASVKGTAVCSAHSQARAESGKTVTVRPRAISRKTRTTRLMIKATVRSMAGRSRC